MTNFRLVFSLFGLLLGLGLAEEVGGFGRAIQSRRKVRISWLTPMLGALVALDLTSFWMVAWSVRELVPAHYVSLLGADRDGSLLPRRAHHLSLRPRRMARLRRPGISSTASGCWGVSCCATSSPSPHCWRWARSRWRARSTDGRCLLFIPALGAAMFAPGRRINLTLLLLLVVQYPLVAVLGYAGVGR